MCCAGPLPSPERRAALEAQFLRWLDQDVTALLPGGPFPELQGRLSRRLCARFVFDWAAVQDNFGGTAGHHSAWLRAKVKLAQVWLEGRPAAEAQAAEEACLRALHAFWAEWAGYALSTAGDPA